MSRRARLLLTALLACVAGAGVLAGSRIDWRLLPAGAAGPGTTERVSVDSAGVQGNNTSNSPAISADGRYVAFESSADNLAAGDTNGRYDVFMRNRATGTTERVSVDSAGVQGNGASYAPTISADGRYAAFLSYASNLVVGDTNDQGDVFVWDRATGTTERVSVDSAGVQGNARSDNPTISADGRYVAFASDANGLVAGDTNGTVDVFVRDRATGTTERVSVDSAGVQGQGNGFQGSDDPAISADGRYVAFLSFASNLVAGDTNDAADIFVRDRATGTTERVSVDSAGVQGNQVSYVRPAISADGRYVAFLSYASNLVAGDTNSSNDIFVRDRAMGTTERVSVDSAGVEGDSSADWYPAISADGRYVAFSSSARNLVAGDTNTVDDVFMRDRAMGTTERVSVDSAHLQANGLSAYPTISADGRYVAFVSAASNLVAGDTNGTWDVFVRDRCPGGSCGGPPIPPVVVLVHGYDSNSTVPEICGLSTPATGSLQAFLDNRANTGNHQFTTDCQVYSTKWGVIAGANELARKVNGWKKAGIPQVDVVAHSMGGLVARYCVQFLSGCAGHIRSLTMIGTPNLGTKMAITPCNASVLLNPFHPERIDQGACDMFPGNSFLKNLNANPNPLAGVSYRVLMGDRSKSRLLAGSANDCIVPVDSAFGLRQRPEPDLGFPHDAPLYVSHTAGNGGPALLGCQGEGELAFLPIQQRVSALLLASNGFAPVAASAAGVNVAIEAVIPTPTATPASSEASTIGSQSGIITQSQTIDVPITMPASQATGTFIFRSAADLSATLTFALLRPGGTPVGTGDADVTYETGPGFGGLVETHYTIAAPASGTWIMRVTGTTVPPSGWVYDMQALVLGGISVTAKAGAGHFDVGQAIAISADVAVNATPYAGATVVATITKPNNTTASVALTDAGGGAYTGSFGDTAACGLYQVTVTASGIDGATPFTRQDRTLAFVGVPGNVILDPCVADSDGDGITDSDEINIYGTNPANPDTDGDGYADKQEIDMAKDPNIYCNIMRADVDGDGAVSILDLTRVAQYFIQSVPPAPARYNQDGDSAISILDLTRMAQVFIQPVSACP